MPNWQATSIEQLVTRTFGEVKPVRLPLQFRQKNLVEQRIEVGNALVYDVRSTENPPSPNVAKHLYPWLFKPMQGLALAVSYKEPGHEEIHYSGTNSLFAEFRLERPSKKSVTKDSPD
jgi:hypothetical protein